MTYLASTSLSSSNLKPALQEITTYLANNLYTGCSANAVLGGASATMDLDRSQTSVSPDMRNALMAITCFSVLTVDLSVNDKKYQVSLMDNLAENVYKKYSSWVYWNEPQHNFPKGDWQQRYWGGMDNYNKLLSVKQKYDPQNMLSCYHCVGYESFENEDPSVCPAVHCTCSNTPQGVCNSAVLIAFDFKFILTCFNFILLFFKLANN